MKPNIVEFKVSGRYALFTDPVNRLGGEKLTYQVPTYQSLKGILESVYWKPTLIWIIDRVRVMKPIRSHSQSIRPVNFHGGNTLSIYTYLSDVEYQVRAHFEWNMSRPELEGDRNENKHHNIAKRCIKKGGRRDIFLGTRECQGYVEGCVYGEGKGAYDGYGEFPLGVMFHGFTYPDENPDGRYLSRFWKPVMKNGEIEFIRPEECSMVRELPAFEPRVFTRGENLSFADDLNIKELFGGEGD